MKLTVPTHIVATLIRLADLANISHIALGISTDEPTPQDTQLGNQVADFPAIVSFKAGKLTINAAVEYGIQLGVNEIGLYAGDKLVATINAQINRINNQPLVLMKYKRVYLLSIEIDTNTMIDGTYPVALQVDEREDITFAMVSIMQQIKGGTIITNGSGVPAPSRIGQVLMGDVVGDNLKMVWADLATIPQTSRVFVSPSPVTPSPAHYKIVGNQVIVPIDGWLEIDDKVYNELAELNQRLTLFVGTMGIKNQALLHTNTAMHRRSKGEYGIVSFNGVYDVSFNGAQGILLDNAMVANVLSSDGTKRTIMPVTEAIAISRHEGVADNADSNPMYIRKAGALTLAEFFDPRDAMSVVAWLKKICHLPDNIIYITFESNICFNPEYVGY